MFNTTMQTSGFIGIKKILGIGDWKPTYSHARRNVFSGCKSAAALHFPFSKVYISECRIVVSPYGSTELKTKIN